MQTKWKNIYLSLIAAVVVAGCGNRTPREEIQPVYHWTNGQIYPYKITMNVDLTADAGLFRFNGAIGLNMDADLKPVGTNQWGTKVQVGLKNPEVTGATGQVSSVVISALNFIRNYMSTIYIQTNGKTTALYQNAPHGGLSSYAQLIFPDFSDMPGMIAGRRTTSEFVTKMQETKMMEVIEVESHVERVASPFVFVTHHVVVRMYDYEEYQNSADRNELGALELNMTDKFDYVRGVLVSKSGYFFVNGAVKMSRGILAYTISVSGSGSFKMDEVTAPVE